MSHEIVLYKGRGKGLDNPARFLGPRRTIDYGSEVVHWMETCLIPRHKPQQLQFHYSYTKELLPPFAQPQLPHDAICCRFVHSSTQKNRAPVNVVHWFPNGRRLLSGSQTGEITIWNGQQFHFENIMQAHNAAVKAMEWTAEETVLVSGDQLGVIKYWDQYLYNFQTFQGHKDSICDITISPTGLKFCSCADDSHAKVWDLRTAQEERAFTGHGWDVKCCSWHPRKGLVATGSKDSQIKLWDPRASEAITTIYCHKNTVSKVRWSPSGQWLASGSRDQLVMLMDIRTMSVRKVFKGHQKEVTALCWHPENDGILASGGYDNAMHFWDTHGGAEPLESVPGAHEGPIWSMAWHPLGHLLATASHDYSTRFWSRPRPSDTNFVDLLPKKIAAPDRDAAAIAAALQERLTSDKIFSAGVFTEPCLPPQPEPEPAPKTPEVVMEEGAETPAEVEEKAETKLLPGLSHGSTSILDTSDFDAADPGAANAQQPAETTLAVYTAPSESPAAAAGALGAARVTGDEPPSAETEAPAPVSAPAEAATEVPSSQAVSSPGASDGDASKRMAEADASDEPAPKKPCTETAPS